MLEVKTPEEVLRLIKKDFHPIGRSETVSLAEALGRNGIGVCTGL